LPAEATDEYKANEIRNFLGTIETEKKTVRLVTELSDGKVKPTTIERVALQVLLSESASVEEDEPTKGMYSGGSQGRYVYNVKGVFRTKESVCEDLNDLLHSVSNGPRGD